MNIDEIIAKYSIINKKAQNNHKNNGLRRAALH